MFRRSLGVIHHQLTRGCRPAPPLPPQSSWAPRPSPCPVRAPSDRAGRSGPRHTVGREEGVKTQSAHIAAFFTRVAELQVVNTSANGDEARVLDLQTLSAISAKCGCRARTGNLAHAVTNVSRICSSGLWSYRKFCNHVRFNITSIRSDIHQIRRPLQGVWCQFNTRKSIDVCKKTSHKRC